MRYRRTFVQRNRERRAWEIPRPGVNHDAYCYSRAQLVTYLQLVGRANAGTVVWLAWPALCFLFTSFVLRRISPSVSPSHRKNRLKRTTRRNLQMEMQRSTISACAGEIAERKFNEQDAANSESSLPGHRNRRHPLLFHAHYLLLYFLQLIC